MFLTDFGFQSPPELRNLTAADGYVQLSAERLDLLDADLLFVSTDKQQFVDELVANPLYNRLDVHRQGRDIRISEETERSCSAPRAASWGS